MMRLATRSLVLCLDFRGLDLASYHFFEQQVWKSEGNKETWTKLAIVFPKLRCVLLDGSPEWLVDFVTSELQIDPGSATTTALNPIFMLTAREAATILQPTFFRSPCMTSLVYLDLSYASGSLKGFLTTASLPSLRVLKVQGRDMGDDTALLLFQVFKQQLWSLDLSENRLTDVVVEPMRHTIFRPTSLRSPAYFDAEGLLNWVAGAGEHWYGAYVFLEESEQSSVLSHPHRHLADPPTYTRHAEQTSQEHANVRHNGRRPVRRDDAESIKQVLLGRVGQLPPSVDNFKGRDICTTYGMTHLRLNGNALSHHGVESVIRAAPGHLEHLECDSSLIEIPMQRLPRWLATARFTGFIGASHLLRPVFSPHLQVLRVHHSLVTLIPTIRTEGLSVGDGLWISESILEPRIAMAYPQPFVPDMNPRLYSLTLTEVPRYSTGPVIEKILSFLKQASIQERAIHDTDVRNSHRNSSTLEGLRHLHLEFGEDPKEAGPDALGLDDIDTTKLLSSEDVEFSFFGSASWAVSSTPAINPEMQRQSDGNQFHHETPLFRPDDPPAYRPGYAETVDNYEYHSGVWNGRAFSVPVWVGKDVSGPHKAVNEYVRLLNDPSSLGTLHTNVGPASPCHVMAGVPAGSYIFHAAWDAILAPPVVRKPTAAELDMRDVVAAIKDYRAKTKTALTALQKAAGTMDVPLGEPHYHWSGKLEISYPSVSHDPGMWR